MMDNSRFLGLNEIENLHTLCDKTNEFIANKCRKSIFYNDLISYISTLKTDDISPNFYNHLKSQSYFLNDEQIQAVSKLIDDIIKDECKDTDRDYRCIPIPLVEIRQSYSSPSFEMILPEYVFKNKTDWNVDKFKDEFFFKKTLLKWNKKLSESIIKIIGDEENIGISCFSRPLDNDLNLRFIVNNIMVDYTLEDKIIEQFHNTTGFKVYSTKYTNIYCTSMYDEVSWVYEGIYKYDCDLENIGKSTINEFIANNVELNNVEFMLGHPKCRKELYGDPELKRETFEDDKYFEYVHKYPDCRHLDLILKYLPAKYFDENMIYSFNIGSNREIFEPVIKHYIVNVHKYDCDFDKEWNKIKYNTINKEFYYKYVLFENNYTPYRNNKFSNEYNEFIKVMIRQFLEIHDGKFSDERSARIVYYFAIGSYYSTIKDNKIIWYEFITKNVQHDEGRLYKWSKTKEIPMELMSRYFVEYLTYFTTHICNSISSDKENASFKKKIKNTIFNIEQSRSESAVMKKIVKLCNNRCILNVMDREGFIVGVYNGILDVGLRDGQTTPVLYQGCTEYYVSKTVRAYFVQEMYESMSSGIENSNNPYIRRMWGIICELIIEEDAREFIMCRQSTSLTNMINVCDILQVIAGGSNGKSVFADSHLHIGGDLMTKLSIHTITSSSKSQSADPELMKTKDMRGGIITETGSGDPLCSKRLKELTELTKVGRNLYEDQQEFSNNLTVSIFSNYVLNVDEQDDGTWRRILYYRFKNRFVNNPLESNKHEKKKDKTISTLVKTDINMANALFAINLYFRVRLYKVYNNDLDNIRNDTIKRETDKYRKEQDKITRFISQQMVIMYGYDADGNIRESIEDIDDYYDKNNLIARHELFIIDIANEYMNWYSKHINNKVNHCIDQIKNDFIDSKIRHLIIRDDTGQEYVKGFRLLQSKKKIDGEFHI